MISIITITKNNLSGLIKTIESIESVYNSSISELIIVDSISKDGSKPFVEKKVKQSTTRIIHIYEEDKGVYDAMNKGVRAAQGEYVIFINSGDKLICKFPEYFLSQKKNYQAGIAFGCHYNFRNFKIKIPSRTTNSKRLRLPGLHQGMLYKKSVLIDFPFSNDYKICGDFEQYIRMTTEKPNLRFDTSEIIIAELESGGISSEKPVRLFKESLKVIIQSNTRFKLYNCIRLLVSLINYQLIYRIDNVIPKPIEKSEV